MKDSIDVRDYIVVGKEITSLTCDCCGKVERNNDKIKEWSEIKTDDITSDGYDSTVSHRVLDVCSYKCYNGILNEEFKKLEDRNYSSDKDARIDGKSLRFYKGTL
jgi:hypothetical protein